MTIVIVGSGKEPDWVCEVFAACPSELQWDFAAIFQFHY